MTYQGLEHLIADLRAAREQEATDLTPDEREHIRRAAIRDAEIRELYPMTTAKDALEELAATDPFAGVIGRYRSDAAAQCDHIRATR